MTDIRSRKKVRNTERDSNPETYRESAEVNPQPLRVRLPPVEREVGPLGLVYDVLLHGAVDWSKAGSRRQAALSGSSSSRQNVEKLEFARS